MKLSSLRRLDGSSPRRSIVARLAAAAAGLLLACGAAIGQSAEPTRVVRFADQREVEAVLVDSNAQGVFLRLSAGGPVTFFRWELMDAASREILQTGEQAAAAASPETQSRGLVIRLTNGDTIRGLVIEGSEGEDPIRLQTPAGLQLVPRSSASTITKAAVRLTDIYAPDVVEEKLRAVVKPRESADYDRLGKLLSEVGLPDRAEANFRIAQMLRRPEPTASRLYIETQRLQRLATSKAGGLQLGEASLAVFLGDLERAAAIVEELRRSAVEESLEAELESLRTALIVQKNQTIESRVLEEAEFRLEGKLREASVNGARTYAESRARATAEIWDEMEAEIASAFGLDRKVVRDIGQNRRGRDERKHDLGRASWLLIDSSRAEGAEWWAGADAETRYRLLKGDLVRSRFSVTGTADKHCPACGGDGELRLPPDGRRGLCGECLGTGWFRVLFYR